MWSVIYFHITLEFAQCLSMARARWSWPWSESCGWFCLGLGRLKGNFPSTAFDVAKVVTVSLVLTGYRLFPPLQLFFLFLLFPTLQKTWSVVVGGRFFSLLLFFLPIAKLPYSPQALTLYFYFFVLKYIYNCIFKLTVDISYMIL